MLQWFQRSASFIHLTKEHIDKQKERPICHVLRFVCTPDWWKCRFSVASTDSLRTLALCQFNQTTGQTRLLSMRNMLIYGGAVHPNRMLAEPWKESVRCCWHYCYLTIGISSGGGESIYASRWCLLCDVPGCKISQLCWKGFYFTDRYAII